MATDRLFKCTGKTAPIPACCPKKKKKSCSCFGSCYKCASVSLARDANAGNLSSETWDFFLTRLWPFSSSTESPRISFLFFFLLFVSAPIASVRRRHCPGPSPVTPVGHPVFLLLSLSRPSPVRPPRHAAAEEGKLCSAAVRRHRLGGCSCYFKNWCGIISVGGKQQRADWAEPQTVRRNHAGNIDGLL